jgi:hypothetical protein
MHVLSMANTNQRIRTTLAQWQAEDGVVPGKGGLPDPPLLALEIEAASAQLTLMKRLFNSAQTGEAKHEIGIQLLRVCSGVVLRFENPMQPVPPPPGASTNGAASTVRLLQFL